MLNARFDVISLSHSNEAVLTFMLSPSSVGLLMWPYWKSNSSPTPGSSTAIVAGKTRSPTTACDQAPDEPARQAAPAAHIRAARAGATGRLRSVRIVFFLCHDRCERAIERRRVWYATASCRCQRHEQ